MIKVDQLASDAYVTLQKILDVAPSDVPGMDFVTCGEISGYKVPFSLVNS